MRKSAVSLLALVLSFGTCLANDPTPTPGDAAVLDHIIFRPNFWETTVEEIGPDLNKLGFRWTSEAKDTVRSANPKMVLGAKPANEALLRVRDGKLSGATVLYFSRGDAGDLKSQEFDDLLAAVTADLTAKLGKAPVERGRDATSAVKAEGRLWELPDRQFLLEWSVTKESRAKSIPFRAEFIRLTLLPAGAPPPAIGQQVADTSSRAAVKRFVGRDHVEKLAGGAWLKDVPMVDQGQKGYCVVASVERVMRYYGADVDQHELAQIANTETEGGTSSNAMVDSMKKLTSRLGVKIKTLFESDPREFMQLINDYNRATKRGKLAPEITGQYRSMEDYYKRMKPEVYKEVRMKEAASFGKFQREIARSIDEGIPLLWTVLLGFVPEKEIPQAWGGHMRLIIGYDNATKEIIYSDSWGMGHEQKRMSYEDAWTITTGLFQLQPIGS